jgi:Transport and Golgi organisation 2
MCTLTVITRANGYLLAMNRDEKIARGAGTSPQAHESDGSIAVYPGDGAGGTWIAANEYGITLALLNWNDVVPTAGKARSRGQLIPSLIGSRSTSELQTGFNVLNLNGILPFGLVGVFPSEMTMGEWRWNSVQLEFRLHAWDSRHWFSSSLSDRQAEALRGSACHDTQREPDAGSAPWLRRLHRSHVGGPGPFSLCVHRDDVQTLSYTEVTCTPETVAFEHFRGSPCRVGSGQRLEIPRAAVPDAPTRESCRSGAKPSQCLRELNPVLFTSSDGRRD